MLAAEQDRVVDPDHATDSIAPRAARVDDDVGRDLAVARDDPGHAPTGGGDAEHLAALVDVKAVALRRPNERLHGLHGIREPGRRLEAGEPDAVELELGPAPDHLVGLERRRLDAEALLHGDGLAESLRPFGWSEQHVADLVESGRPSELLLGVREHRGTSHRQPDPDLVRVVLTDVRRRVLGRAAADLPLLDERDLAEAELRQEVSGARSHDSSTDHDGVRPGDHVLLLSSRSAAVAASSASPSAPITTPYSSFAAAALTFASPTSRSTAAGSRESGSPKPPPPAIRWT